MAIDETREKWLDATTGWAEKVLPLDDLKNPEQSLKYQQTILISKAKGNFVNFPYLRPGSPGEVVGSTQASPELVDKFQKEKTWPKEWWSVEYQGEAYLIKPSKFKTRNLSEKVKRRHLPTWLSLASVWPHWDDSEVDAVHKARSTRKKEGKPGDLDECQAEAIEPSKAERMEGYYRVYLAPDKPIKNRTKAGTAERKRSDEAKQKAIRYKKKVQNMQAAEEGENVAIRVEKVNCKDATPPGYYWTVWMNTPRAEDAVRFQDLKTGEVYGGEHDPQSDDARAARRKLAKEGEKSGIGKTTIRKTRHGQTKAGGKTDDPDYESGYAVGVPLVQSARPAARVHETCPVCNAPALSDLRPRDQKFWSKPMHRSTGVGCRSGWEYPEDWEPTVMIKKGDEKVRVQNKPGGKATNPHLPRVNKYIERVGIKVAEDESKKYRRRY